MTPPYAADKSNNVTGYAWVQPQTPDARGCSRIQLVAPLYPPYTDTEEETEKEIEIDIYSETDPGLRPLSGSGFNF